MLSSGVKTNVVPHRTYETNYMGFFRIEKMVAFTEITMQNSHSSPTITLHNITYRTSLYVYHWLIIGSMQNNKEISSITFALNR